MEFMCVLSVGGSLATFRVEMKSENRYLATLRTLNKESSLPSEITLLKTEAGWSGRPPHDEIVPGLANAIEAKSSLDDEPQSPAP